MGLIMLARTRLYINSGNTKISISERVIAELYFSKSPGFINGQNSRNGGEIKSHFCDTEDTEHQRERKDKVS